MAAGSQHPLALQKSREGPSKSHSSPCHGQGILTGEVPLGEVSSGCSTLHLQGFGFPGREDVQPQNCSLTQLLGLAGSQQGCRSLPVLQARDDVRNLLTPSLVGQQTETGRARG